MIAEKWLRAGPAVVADYLWDNTRLGAFLVQPKVADVLAEDALIEAVLLPYICTPDYFENEAALIESWRALRPEQHKVAMDHVGAIRGAYAGMGESEAWKARERLRLAACRKLDATVTGYESFARHAMLAGDPSSKVCDKVLGLELKIGTVKDAVYGQEKKVSGIPGALQEIRAVRFAERALLPFVPEEEDAAAWGVRYALWKELESARAFEEGCKWLLLPAMVCVTSPILFEPGAGPEDYIERFRPEELEPYGMGYEELCQLGISPYLGRPLAEFVAAHPALLDQFRSPSMARKFLLARVEGSASARRALQCAKASWRSSRP
jgi:hypothetical protein